MAKSGPVPFLLADSRAQREFLSLLRPRCGWSRIALLSFLLFGTAFYTLQIQAQAVPSAYQDGPGFFAGVSGSLNYLQYGERRMGGYSAYVDVDFKRHMSIEAAYSRVKWLQRADVQTTSYLFGPRYRFYRGKWQIYGKTLLGRGEFDFPYAYAKGSYLVVAPGAGLDYRLTRSLHLRPVDIEYAYWPQFTFGALSTLNVTSGIRIRLF